MKCFVCLVLILGALTPASAQSLQQQFWQHQQQQANVLRGIQQQRANVVIRNRTYLANRAAQVAKMNQIKRQQQLEKENREKLEKQYRIHLDKMTSDPAYASKYREQIDTLKKLLIGAGAVGVAGVAWWMSDGGGTEAAEWSADEYKRAEFKYYQEELERRETERQVEAAKERELDEYNRKLLEN